MKITILANRDLASNLALNRLIPSLAKDHQLHVFLSSQTAYTLGFKDPAYFSRFFKRLEGVSPSEYRKANNYETTRG